MKENKDVILTHITDLPSVLTTTPRLERTLNKPIDPRKPSSLALLLASAMFLFPTLAAAQENNMTNNMANNAANNSTGDMTDGGETTPTPTNITKPEFNTGARAAGMAEAHNALSEGTGGMWHNPAGIARAYMYALEGNFSYTPTGNVLSAAIVDSKTNPKISAGLGLGYFFSRTAGPEVTALDIRLPIAVPVVQDRVSVGLRGRYLRAKAGELEIINGFSLDAGVLFRVQEGIHLGISALNLIDPCKNVLCEGIAPLTVGAGGSFSRQGFTAAVDAEFDLGSGDSTGVNVDVGGEYLIEDMVPVRLGYQFKSLSESHGLAIGSGWRSKTAGVDLSYQHDLTVQQFGRLLLGVSVYF